jgi:NAD(P)-dependent dehydrogenase (short-subunit alcohol dehydrogenase family)
MHSFNAPKCCSGIGLAAAKLLVLNNPLHRIILACRTQESADRACKEVSALLPRTSTNDELDGDATGTHNKNYYTDNIIPLQCDHTSFESIQQFNTQLRIKLEETYTPSKWLYNGIDVLCLNAAVLVPEQSLPQYTVDDCEVTLQTNYFAPFLLVQLLLDRINQGGRIVLTTSGLFDRVSLENFHGILDPTTQQQRLRKPITMISDAQPFQYKTAYSVSKLCVVALCSELVDRIPKHRNITINCFSPGLMTTSGLFRNQSFPNDCTHNNHNNTNSNNDATNERTNHNHSNEKQQAHPLPQQQPQHSVDVLLKEKTVEWGAGALVYMALSTDTVQHNGQYWSDTHSTLGAQSQYGIHFTPVDIMNHVPKATRETLWNVSCQVVGVTSCSPMMTSFPSEIPSSDSLQKTTTQTDDSVSAVV